MRAHALCIAACAAILVASCASAGPQAAEQVQFKVLEADARIPFGASDVRSFSVGPDKALILEGRGGRMYRAELDPYCESLLPWEFAIALDGQPTGAVDRWSSVIIDGRKCRFRTFDEVERIKAAEPEQTQPDNAAPTSN